MAGPYGHCKVIVLIFKPSISLLGSLLELVSFLMSTIDPIVNIYSHTSSLHDEFWPGDSSF